MIAAIVFDAVPKILQPQVFVFGVFWPSRASDWTSNKVIATIESRLAVV